MTGLELALAKQEQRLKVRIELARLQPRMKYLRRELTLEDIGIAARAAKHVVSAVEKKVNLAIGFDTLERILNVYLELEKHDASRTDAGTREESSVQNVA
jgi:hypothetical protein